MLVDGSPADHRSINKVGLERYSFSTSEIERARAIFKTLFQGGVEQDSGHGTASQSEK